MLTGMNSSILPSGYIPKSLGPFFFSENKAKMTEFLSM